MNRLLAKIWQLRASEPHRPLLISKFDITSGFRRLLLNRMDMAKLTKASISRMINMQLLLFVNVIPTRLSFGWTKSRNRLLFSVRLTR